MALETHDQSPTHSLERPTGNLIPQLIGRMGLALSAVLFASDTQAEPPEPEIFEAETIEHAQQIHVTGSSRSIHMLERFMERADTQTTAYVKEWLECTKRMNDHDFAARAQATSDARSMYPLFAEHIKKQLYPLSPSDVMHMIHDSTPITPEQRWRELRTIAGYKDEYELRTTRIPIEEGMNGIDVLCALGEWSNTDIIIPAELTKRIRSVSCTKEENSFGGIMEAICTQADVVPIEQVGGGYSITFAPAQEGQQILREHNDIAIGVYTPATNETIANVQIVLDPEWSVVSLRNSIKSDRALDIHTINPLPKKWQDASLLRTDRVLTRNIRPQSLAEQLQAFWDALEKYPQKIPAPFDVPEANNMSIHASLMTGRRSLFTSLPTSNDKVHEDDTIHYLEHITIEELANGPAYIITYKPNNYRGLPTSFAGHALATARYAFIDHNGHEHKAVPSDVAFDEKTIVVSIPMEKEMHYPKLRIDRYSQKDPSGWNGTYIFSMALPDLSSK